MEIKKRLNWSALTLVLLLPAFISCKKTAIQTDIATEPVVIAYIAPGQLISVRVNEQKALEDTATYGAAISGLALHISDGAKSLALTEQTAGLYTANDNGFLVGGKTYTLSFTYNGNQVSASSVMPAKPTGYTCSASILNLPLALGSSAGNVALTFNWNNPDSLYHVIVFKNNDSNPFNIRPQSRAPFNFTLNANKTASMQVLYRSLNYIGVYKVMLYRVNQEYIDLLNNSNTATSTNLANPPTNVNGGLGIFTAMQADTVSVTLTQY